MTLFKTLLLGMFVMIVAYTVVAISNEGINLIPFFFAALVSLGWQGQFNLDFSLFLALSGIWIAWRHDFTGKGIFLGLLTVGGMIYMSIYLLIMLHRADNDLRVLLLGERRATS